MIRYKWSSFVVVLVVVASACDSKTPDRDQDQAALVHIDSMLHNGMTASNVTTFFDAEGFNWTFERYPDFFGEIGLDSARINELGQQGLSGRYVALAKEPASGTSLFGSAHVRVEVYMNANARSIALHRGLHVVK